MIGGWRPTPSPIGWRQRSRGLVELAGLALSCLCLRSRDGDCSWVTGSARGKLEDATAAAFACWPDYPAGQLAVARGRCDQWAKRGAEAGREALPPSAPYPWSVVGGHPGALLPGTHPVAMTVLGALSAPARERPPVCGGIKAGLRKLGEESRTGTLLGDRSGGSMRGCFGESAEDYPCLPIGPSISLKASYTSKLPKAVVLKPG